MEIYTFGVLFYESLDFIQNFCFTWILLTALLLVGEGKGTISLLLGGCRSSGSPVPSVDTQMICVCVRTYYFWLGVGVPALH